MRACIAAPTSPLPSVPAGTYIDKPVGSPSAGSPAHHPTRHHLHHQGTVPMGNIESKQTGGEPWPYLRRCRKVVQHQLEAVQGSVSALSLPPYLGAQCISRSPHQSSLYAHQLPSHCNVPPPCLLLSLYLSCMRCTSDSCPEACSHSHLPAVDQRF